MIQCLSEMDDHLSRRDSYMATAGANNRKIFSKNKYIASELCTLSIKSPVHRFKYAIRVIATAEVAEMHIKTFSFLFCFNQKVSAKIQIDFCPAKIKLLIFLVSKILFLLMERCTIRVLMLMQCNSPKGCRRFQGLSSISTSILA